MDDSCHTLVMYMEKLCQICTGDMHVSCHTDEYGVACDFAARHVPHMDASYRILRVTIVINHGAHMDVSLPICG